MSQAQPVDGAQVGGPADGAVAPVPTAPGSPGVTGVEGDGGAGSAGGAGESVADRERPRTIRAPWAAPAVAKVRRAVVEDLEQRELPSELIDESEIVVSELVGNAIRHARPLPDGTIRVHWKVKAGVVEIEVSDGGGPSVPRPAPRSVWAPTGRGLRIVRSLAHEWGVSDERTGRTVWAALGGPSRRRSR